MSDNAIVKSEDKELLAVTANRLRYMIVNGRKLQDQEVMALATYSAMNDLNPFAGECYYIDGVGAAPGIAGWRKKAQEQLEYEASTAKLPGAHFWTEKRKATSEDCKLSPGDVGIVVTLRDWITNSRWRHDYFEAVRFLREVGDPNPLENAKKISGPEPMWEGLGVVRGDESFGRGDKAWTREERAEKRAEKLAIRKRFPRIHLPEPIGVDVDYVDSELIEPQPRIQAGAVDTDKIISELGFETQPLPSPVVSQEARSEAQPVTVGKNAWDVDPMPYEDAELMVTSNGQNYTDIADNVLVKMVGSCITHIKDGGEPEGIPAWQRKLAAIRSIQMHRAWN